MTALASPEKSATELKMLKNRFVSETTVTREEEATTTDQEPASNLQLRKSKSYGLGGSLRMSEKLSALKELDSNNQQSINQSDIREIKVRFGLQSSRSS